MKINEENENEKDKDDQEGQGGQTGEGKGGVAGKIHFRYKDAASLEPRDDMLPPSEIKRLLVVHRELHKSRVEKQKHTRKEREVLKSGRLNQAASYQLPGSGNTGGSQYKKHPISNKAQFSGIDKQINNVPTELDAETNLEMREKLENRFVHRQVPKFNPKPRPPGG